MSRVNASPLLHNRHASQSAPQPSLYKHGQPVQSSLRFRKKWEFRAWYETWLIEHISMGVCITCAVAIAIVLLLFAGKSLPTLPRGITMNAIVSVLATGSKSNLLLIMASSISQLEWVRYQKTAPLGDMQLFEDAARGPLGSLQLLMRHGFSSLASIGASILFLSLAFELFVKQVLTYPILPGYVNSSQLVCEFGCTSHNSHTTPSQFDFNCTIVPSTSSSDNFQQIYQVGADVVIGNIAKSLTHLSSGIYATPITGQAVYSIVHVHIESGHG